MTATRDGNIAANLNGMRWEKHISRTDGIKIHPNATTDAGRLEVKSCQKYISDGDHRRSGRFTFYRHQQKELIARRGTYIFIVHQSNRKIAEKRVSAARMEKYFHLTKAPQTTVSWPSVFDLR